MVYFIAESSDFNRVGWRVFYSVGNGRVAYFPELHPTYDAALKAMEECLIREWCSNDEY